MFFGSEDHPELNAELDRLATLYGVTPTAIATAWITRHPVNMQVVLGTTNPQRIAEGVAGSDLPLTGASGTGCPRLRATTCRESHCG